MKNNLACEITHIIVNHAQEGNCPLKSPEAVIVNKMNMLNFVVLKSFAGMI